MKVIIEKGKTKRKEVEDMIRRKNRSQIRKKNDIDKLNVVPDN